MKSLRNEIEDNGGYHIFSTKRNQEHNYYPEAFNNYPGVSLSDLKINDMITIKAFYIEASDPSTMLKDIYIELLVNEICADTVKDTILTSLIPKFPLNRGDVLEVAEDEILYRKIFWDFYINLHQQRHEPKHHSSGIRSRTLCSLCRS